MSEWIEMFNQSLEGFWKVFTVPTPNPPELILKISYDYNVDDWEESNKYYKSFARLRIVYDDYNLIVSPSEAIYPKIEEEIRIIKLNPHLPALKLGVRKYSYVGDTFLNQTILPLGLQISRLNI